jgi:hypothetical protein
VHSPGITLIVYRVALLYELIRLMTLLFHVNPFSRQPISRQPIADEIQLSCLLLAIATVAGTSAVPGSTKAAAAPGGSSGTADSDDPVVAAAVAAAEAKLLRRQLAAAEKQAAAMKDVFKQRVKAFRESCRCGCVR